MKYKTMILLVPKPLLSKTQTNQDYYSPKTRVLSFFTSRNIRSNDVGNTLACTTSTTLIITSGFSEIKVEEIVNLGIHNFTLPVKRGSGVLINGRSDGNGNVANDEVYTRGIVRKTSNIIL